MAVGLILIYAALLIPGGFHREGKERIVYIVLSALALVSAVAAGSILRTDHVGASLSGMVSIFMR
ncbi:MAG: hypothetical protein IIV97_05880 [Oscillospiraceae bacterium]|nr:hypothetical protein [Oscillospiraceae bacterium]